MSDQPVNALSFRSATCRSRRPNRVARRHLDVPEREFVAILGPNGVGKSTLLNALLGLVPLREGEIDVLGRPPGASNHEIGYLPQRRSFDPSVRIRGIDIVRLGLDGDRYGLPFPGAREPARSAAGRRARRSRRRARVRRSPDRTVFRRRAAAAPDRAGARAQAAVAATRRTARQPRSPEPGRGGRARFAHLSERRRDRVDRRPRRESDPELPRSGGVSRERRRRVRARRKRCSPPRRSRASTRLRSRCCMRPTAGSSWSGSRRRRATTRACTTRTDIPTEPVGEPSFAYHFMVNAFRAGTAVAVVAAVVGWFMVLRARDVRRSHAFRRRLSRRRRRSVAGRRARASASSRSASARRCSSPRYPARRARDSARSPR